MKRITALAMSTVLVALAFLPCLASAQEETSAPTTPDEQTRARARALADEAAAAFEAGEFQSALDKFRAGYDLVPLQQLRFNIALCYERLARLREAAIEYEALVDADSLSEEARERAREAVERLRARFATLRFAGFEGLVVRVDGDATCNVPCELTTDPGRHLVEGLGPETRSVELAEGEVMRLVAEAPTAPETDDDRALDPMPDEPEAGYAPGALFYVGAVTTALGAAGIITFGLLAQDQHAQFEEFPTDATASEGALMRDLANVSIAVTITGALLVVLDVILGLANTDR